MRQARPGRVCAETPVGEVEKGGGWPPEREALPARTQAGRAALQLCPFPGVTSTHRRPPCWQVPGFMATRWECQRMAVLLHLQLHQESPSQRRRGRFEGRLVSTDSRSARLLRGRAPRAESPSFLLQGCPQCLPGERGVLLRHSPGSARYMAEPLPTALACWRASFPCLSEPQLPSDRAQGRARPAPGYMTVTPPDSATSSSRWTGDQDQP